MTTNERPRLGWGFALAFLPAAAFTWVLHEYAHWQMGELLGYDMWISLNQAGPTKGSYDSDLYAMLVSGAGPVVTYLQAAVAFAAVLSKRRIKSSVVIVHIPASSSAVNWGTGWSRYQNVWVARSSKRPSGAYSSRMRREVSTVKRTCFVGVIIAPGLACGRTEI